MRRKRNAFPIKAVLLGLVLVLAGIMVFNSGVLVDLGLLKSNIPEDIGIDPNDPRVIEKVDEAIDRNGIKESVNRMINLITGKPEQGTITVFAHDEVKEINVSGFVFELQDAITNETLEIITTGNEGMATSMPLNYKRAYRLLQIESPDPYQASDNMIVFEMKAPIVELHMQQLVHSRVKDYVQNSDGSVKITEVSVEVPLILQKPELPNGCEITALASILNYYNYPIDKETLSDDYLPMSPFYRKDGKLYGADPDIAFSGNPRDPHGWFVYAPPTVKAGNDYLATISSSHEVKDITGATQSEIMQYVEAGIPVGIWATRDLSLANYGYGWYLEGSDTYFEAAINLHCMVIYGFKGDELYVMDPLEGNMLYDIESFFASYESLGSRAMVVEEVQDAN